MGNPEAEPLGGGVIRSFIGYNIKRSYMVVHSAVQAALAPHDLRIVSFTSLSIITDQPGIAPSKLAEMLQMERSNIVVILDDLETRDLIDRRRMKTDRRRYALNATMHGRRLRDLAAQSVVEVESRIFASFRPGEREMLLRLLNRVENTASTTQQTAPGPSHLRAAKS